MSILRPGTQCVIVAGCPENIGLIVEVIQHLGAFEGREDAYEIKTITGRPFNQLWSGNDLLRGYSDYAITDRYKLRPLGAPGLDTDTTSAKTDEQWVEEFAEEYGRGPDAQELHDWMNRDRKPVSPGSRKRLQKTLAKKAAPLGFDPIASAMADNPGLTREQAEADARALGF